MLCPSISIQPSLSSPAAAEATRACPCAMRDCHCLQTNQFRQSQTYESIPRSSITAASDRCWSSAIETQRRQRARNYNPLAVCVTIDRLGTTDNSLAAIFAAGCRCVHLPLHRGTRPQLDALSLRLLTAIAAHYLRAGPHAQLIATCCELRGQLVRTGRLHNDRPVVLRTGARVFLTANPEYELSSSADVIYLANFERYLRQLAVGEFVFIDRYRIQLVIAKVTHRVGTITCCVLRGSHLESYMDVTLPYLLPADEQLTAADREDCAFAVAAGADYVVVPGVTGPGYLRAIRAQLSQGGRELCSPKVLAQVDVSSLAGQQEELLAACDGLWLADRQRRKGVSRAEGELICAARKSLKPVVMAMGRPRKSQEYAFMLYEGDCFLLKQFSPYIRKTIERSVGEQFAKRFTEDKKNVQVEEMKEQMLSTRDPVSVVLDSSVFIAMLLDAQLIVCTSFDGQTPIRLSHDRPACPILVVVDKRRLARQLTIYKNLMPMVYKADGPDEEEEQKEGSGNSVIFGFDAIKKRLAFGVERAKDLGLLIVGDLVIYCYDNFGSGQTNSDQTTSYQASYVSEEVVTF